MLLMHGLEIRAVGMQLIKQIFADLKASLFCFGHECTN